MSNPVWSLFAGVVFGLALAAPPGPMNAVIAEESVGNGWGAGFRAGLGAMSADAVFFLLALLGVVRFVEQFPLVRSVMVGGGGVLMLYFAYGAAREVGSSFRPDGRSVFRPDGRSVLGGSAGGVDGSGGSAARDTDVRAAAGFRKAFALALTNPYQILFWLTIGVGLLEPGTVDVLGHTPYVGERFAGLFVVRTGSPALIAGFFGGLVVWIVSFPAALVTAERRVDAFAPAVAGASALVLAGFGLLFLRDALSTLPELLA